MFLLLCCVKRSFMKICQPSAIGKWRDLQYIIIYSYSFYNNSAVPSSVVFQDDTHEGLFLSSFFILASSSSMILLRMLPNDKSKTLKACVVLTQGLEVFNELWSVNEDTSTLTSSAAISPLMHPLSPTCWAPSLAPACNLNYW